MTQRSRHARYALVLAAALLAAGCSGGADDAAAARMDVDTTNKDWADGLSVDQIQENARAMTPEQAAAAGVALDTTIHVENLGPDSSAFGRPTAAAPVDTSTSPVGRSSTQAGPAPARADTGPKKAPR